MPDTTVKFFHLSVDETLRQLNTTHAGLTQHEAKRRQGYYGTNVLPEQRTLTWVHILVAQFTSPLIYVLLAAALVSLILQAQVDATVIIIAVIIQVLVGFIQEFKAQQSLLALKRVLNPQVPVRRAGEESIIPISKLVPGDIVLLQAGDKVAADMRLLAVGELEVNEAALTGEVEPIKKDHRKIQAEAVVLAERNNMVFAGTVITKGTGLGVVTHTGLFTELGKIAQLIQDLPNDATPLQRQLARFSKKISIVVIVIALIIFVVGYISNNSLIEIFTVAVAVAVSSIPEGMAIAVTIILASGMRRILQRRGLVRKLVAAEALGSTNVICVDKTGTLTAGNMQVTDVVTWETEFAVNGKDRALDEEAKDLLLVLRMGLLCNDAKITNPDDPIADQQISGNLTERALLSAALQAGLHLEELLKEAPRLDVHSFDSNLKYMATLHREAQGHMLYIKGAPEVIITHCKKVRIGSKIVNFDEDKREQFQKKFIKLSKRGLRIIALAYKHAASAKTIEEVSIAELVFVGYVGIRDPLRPEAKQTVALCKQAGIRVVMITGDHKLTAQAIAQELGLEWQADHVIEGPKLDELTQHELNQRVLTTSVYARVTPEHKLRIVQAWQANGLVVAMTGDGINDSPAIKAADIGVALGSGTDVAKETADLVILDDNFSTIVAAIEEGRAIFDNIKKTVLYLLSDSFSEVILITGSLFLGLPVPITAAQILWINIVNDSFPSLAMTQEPKEPENMQEVPRGHSNHILDREVKFLIGVVSLITGVCNLVIFYYLYHHFGDVQPARTIIFLSFGLDSLIFMFSLRSLRKMIYRLNPFSNRWLVGSLVLGVIAQIIAIYIPFLQPYFGTVALGWRSWAAVGGLIVMELLIIEVCKYIFLRRTTA